MFVFSLTLTFVFLYQKPMRSDEAAVQVKLEATKRKLQERYQQLETGMSKSMSSSFYIPSQSLHRS